MDFVNKPALKAIYSFLIIDLSRNTGILNKLPKGGTEPGIQSEIFLSSSSVANLSFFVFRIFLSFLELNFLFPEITNITNSLSVFTIKALAPIFISSSLYNAASSEVLVGGCSLTSYEKLFFSMRFFIFKKTSLDIFYLSSLIFNSFNCSLEISEGELSIGFSACLFLGKAITSLMSLKPNIKATNLSTPRPIPP